MGEAFRQYLGLVGLVLVDNDLLDFITEVHVNHKERNLLFCMVGVRTVVTLLEVGRVLCVLTLKLG